MSNPVFTLGANVLNFSKNENYPVTAPREAIQAIDRTAAGTLEVETLGTVIKRRTLTFSNLPAGDFAALVDWFDNVSVGAANAFTFTDDEGVPWSVVWTNGFNFTEDKAGYSGSIELEIVA
jgi:hypothetical protein